MNVTPPLPYLTLPYFTCVTLSPPSSPFQALKILLVTIITVGNAPLPLPLLSSQLLDCLDFANQPNLRLRFVPLCQAHRTEQNRHTNLKELVEKDIHALLCMHSSAEIDI